MVRGNTKTPSSLASAGPLVVSRPTRTSRPRGHGRQSPRFLLVGTLLTLLVASPTFSGVRRAGDRSARLPVLVSLVFHHSTRGIHDHALPMLRAIDARATLGLVAMELERTMIPPEVVSLLDQPGGFGNVQPVSLGDAGADGLFTGRRFLEDPDRRMTDAEIRTLAAAGWELAFHGVDHTPQTGIVAQVDGPGKLARAYAAGNAEIRRLLGDETWHVRTNTLPSNHWNEAVRAIAAPTFDWTEVRWNGFPYHVPVVFGLQQENHGGFNSIDFERWTFDGLADLDDLVRFGDTDPAAWLIIQLHDVVPEPDDSPDPPTALRVSEFAYLLDRLQAIGAHIVPFSEAAELVTQRNAGNRLRNTRFGVNAFLPPPRRQPMDWQMGVWDGDGMATVDFAGDGTIVLTSPAAPATVTISQAISPSLLRGRRFVLRARLDAERFWEGSLKLSVKGPTGTHEIEIAPGQNETCLEFDVRAIGSRHDPIAVHLLIEALAFFGDASLSDLFLGPSRGRGDGCGSGARTAR